MTNSSSLSPQTYGNDLTVIFGIFEVLGVVVPVVGAGIAVHKYFKSRRTKQVGADIETHRDVAVVLTDVNNNVEEVAEGATTVVDDEEDNNGNVVDDNYNGDVANDVTDGHGLYMNFDDESIDEGIDVKEEDTDVVNGQDGYVSTELSV